MRNLFTLSVAQVIEIVESNGDCNELVLIADDETLSICPAKAKGEIDLSRCLQLTRINEDKEPSAN